MRGMYNVNVALPNAFLEDIVDAKASPSVSFIGAGPTPMAVLVDEYDETGILQPQWTYAFRDGRLRHLERLLPFHKTMYSALEKRYQNVSDDKLPALMVIDRYSFGAFDFAHSRGIPFVVHNPHFLSDIDDPPLYVPAPYSGFRARDMHATWTRFLNYFYRVRYRASLLDAFHRINAVREASGLATIRSRSDLYGGSVVITDTSFGFEFSRPISPLYRMVGPILPPAHGGPAAIEGLSEWLDDHNGIPLAILHFGPDVRITPSQAQEILGGILCTRLRNASPICFERILTVSLSKRNSKDIVVPLLSQGEDLMYPTWKAGKVNSHYFFACASLHDVLAAYGSHPSLEGSPILTTTELQSVYAASYHRHPLTILPLTPDQVEVAHRVASLRAGAWLRAPRSGPEADTGELRVHACEAIEANSEASRSLAESGIPLSACNVARAIHASASLPEFLKGARVLRSIVFPSGGVPGVVTAADTIEEVIALGSEGLLLPTQSLILRMHGDVYVILLIVFALCSMLVRMLWMTCAMLWRILPIDTVEGRLQKLDEERARNREHEDEGRGHHIKGD